MRRKETFQRGRTMLEQVDLSQKLDKADYKTRMDCWAINWESCIANCMNGRSRRSLCLKAGTQPGAALINELILRLDPLADSKCLPIIPVMPTPRPIRFCGSFWNTIPAAGKLMIYDKSNL